MQLHFSLTVLTAALLAGCAAVPADSPVSSAHDAPAAPAAPATGLTASVAATAVPVQEEAFGAGAVVQEYGVRLTGVRLSANGYVVDLRYRVLDPAKAQALLDRKVRPVLVDESTGNRFYVPVPPTVGALRQTSRNKVIHTDRDYFMLFANPDRKLQAGSKVALYVGDQRFGNLQIAAQNAAPAPTAGRAAAQPAVR
jgi:hypothetical protein